jgi:membrane protein implicated in regulation of membrane protease activity
MFEYQNIIWIALGFILILLEISVLPGIGLLFAGLGAISTNVLLEFNLIQHNWLLEIISFAVLSGVWAALLWVPLKRSSRKTLNQSYNNIIGSTAYIHDGELKPDQIGSVKWSGVVMKAKLAEGENTLLQEGQAVTIVAIKENILYVAKQEPQY